MNFVGSKPGATMAGASPGGTMTGAQPGGDFVAGLALGYEYVLAADGSPLIDDNGNYIVVSTEG